jgi:hypothetical protein
MCSGDGSSTARRWVAPSHSSSTNRRALHFHPSVTHAATQRLQNRQRANLLGQAPTRMQRAWHRARARWATAPRRDAFRVTNQDQSARTRVTKRAIHISWFRCADLFPQPFTSSAMSPVALSGNTLCAYTYAQARASPTAASEIALTSHITTRRSGYQTLGSKTLAPTQTNTRCVAPDGGNPRAPESDGAAVANRIQYLVKVRSNVQK